MMAKAGESVSEEAVPADGEERGVGSKKGDFKMISEIDEEPVTALLTADVMAVEGEVEVVVSKDIAKPGRGLKEAASGGVCLQE